MALEIETRGEHTLLRLRGTMTMGDATRSLAQALADAESQKRGAVLCDLTDLKSLDSTALGILVGSVRRLHGAGREMALVNPNERVALLLSVTQIETLFAIHPTLAAAFQALDWKAGEGVTDGGHRRPDSL
jgi:anti-anti-sigma factor